MHDEAANDSEEEYGVLQRGGMGQKTFVDKDYTLVSEAHFSVLQRLAIAELYIDEHLIEVRRDNTCHTDF
jgi:hypothetical protein